MWDCGALSRVADPKDWFKDPELYWKWFLTGCNVEVYLLRVLKCLETDAKLDKLRRDSEDMYNEYWQIYFLEMWSSFNVVVESSQKYKNKFSLRFRDSYSSREQRTLFVVIHSCKYIPIYSCSLQHIFIKSLLQFFQYNPLFQQRISRGHFKTKRALFVHSI